VDGIRYLSSSEPISVLSASHVTHTPPSPPTDFVPNIDPRTVATLSLPNDAVGTVICDLGMPRTGFLPRMPHNAIIVECEGGKIELSNYMLPTLYHSITVTLHNGASRVEKAYTFEHGKLGDREENWWMSYRYQLEAFVDPLRGKTPQTWVTLQDSAANMEWIEKIYAKVCAYRPHQCCVTTTFQH
jgi:predicted dehydrogenase